VIVGHLFGRGYPGANFSEMLYLVNVDIETHTLQFDGKRGKRYVLHPVHRASGATDRRAAELASYDAASGSFTVPAVDRGGVRGGVTAGHCWITQGPEPERCATGRLSIDGLPMIVKLAHIFGSFG
jgi:hypothetical protein